MRRRKEDSLARMDDNNPRQAQKQIIKQKVKEHRRTSSRQRDTQDKLKYYTNEVIEMKEMYERM